MILLILMSVVFIIYLVIALWHTLRSFRYSIFYQVISPGNRWVISAELIFLLLAPITGFIRFHYFENSGEVVFAKPHLLTLMALALVGGGSFWLSKLHKKDASPWLMILLPLGLLQGVLINLTLAIHFGKHLWLGAAFPLLGFELLAPIINILLISRELYHNHLNFLHRFKNEPIASSNYLILSLYILMDSSFFFKLRLFVFLLAPILIFQLMVLILLGQSPDAIVQVFTNTKGFTFSQPGKNTMEIITGLI